MNAEEQATEVLKKAEAGLRELVSAAASAGDYAAVVRVAAWAKSIGAMVTDGEQMAEVTGSSGPAKPQPDKGISTSGKAPRHDSKAEYPQFFRQGDQLIRIGWSKREKREYSHKAPHSVFQALVKKMAELGQNGRILSTADLLPLPNTDGTDVPAYQAYVGIALLKHASLIDQHGRRGYSIPRPAEFKDAVEATWEKLTKQ